MNRRNWEKRNDEAVNINQFGYRCLYSYCKKTIFLKFGKQNFSMNVAEMKKEIHDKINKLDESQLKMVEKFIEKINLQTTKWDLKKYVDEILNERGEVLQKLAK